MNLLLHLVYALPDQKKMMEQKLIMLLTLLAEICPGFFNSDSSDSDSVSLMTLIFDTLSLKRDQNQFSPHIANTQSIEKVRRIKS